MEELTRLVERFGRIKLAPGIAGKSAYVGIAAIIVLGILALRVPPTDHVMVFLVVGAVILVFLIVVVANTLFARRNPGAALLEGAELIAWAKHEHAAKGIGSLPERPSVPEPSGLPPAVEEDER